jgi:hypothetical protein
MKENYTRKEHSYSFLLQYYSKINEIDAFSVTK